MSHVVAVVALSRAQSKAKGREGRPGEGAEEGVEGARSVVGKQLRVEMMERGGGVMAPRPLCHTAPSQVRGEACWPLAGKEKREKR